MTNQYNFTRFSLLGSLSLALFFVFIPVSAEVSQQTMIDVFQRLDQLEKKSRELVGENEVLKHDLEKLKKIQKEGFLNVDERVEALAIQIKSAAKQSPSTTTATTDTTTQTQNSSEKVATPEEKNSDDSQKQSSTNDESATVTKETVDKETEKVAKEEGQPEQKTKIKAPTKYEKETYQAAFAKMKKSPTAGTRAFEEYIKMQPNSPLAANAQYWIGEIKYSHNNYKGAVQDFIKVLQNYKYSDKAPDAAIKLGYSFYALKNWVYARRTFDDVLKYFPENENAVNLAKKRLAKLDAAGH